MLLITTDCNSLHSSLYATHHYRQQFLTHVYSMIFVITDSSSLHRSTVCYSSLQTVIPYTVLQYATHRYRQQFLTLVYSMLLIATTNSSLHCSAVHHLLQASDKLAFQLGGIQCMSVCSHWWESQSQYEGKLTYITLATCKQNWWAEMIMYLNF